MIPDLTQTGEIHLQQNAKAEKGTPYPDDLKKIFSQEMAQAASRSIHQWKGYAPTPLISLTGVAKELGIHSLYYKDESSRFGLGSFKALGGAYAVLQVLQRHLKQVKGIDAEPRDIQEGKYAEEVAKVTVATATDGNHGRSVAWGAQQFGCPCVIYIHSGVSEGREKEIKKYGAKVVRVEGNYDDSVRQADEDVKQYGWHLVSDTSYKGYTDLPRYVLSGYSVMTDEIMEQYPGDQPITHVFLQGGVGGLASGVYADLWIKMGADRPHFVVVEPELAPCLYESAKAGKMTSFHIEEETIMAGLSCGEVSLLSWKILERCCDSFMTVSDKTVPPLMRMLAQGACGADPIEAGESAVPGLAGLIAAIQSPTLSQSLGLNEHSRVLVIGTEGATDPEIYQSIVGKTAHA